jgi:hypothetical protein
MTLIIATLDSPSPQPSPAEGEGEVGPDSLSRIGKGAVA